MALLWIVLITIPLGIVSAVRKDRFCDHLIRIMIRIITILGISIPAFWLGYLLLTAFAIRIPVFKVVDYGNLRSLILPSITLAASVVSSSVRMLRATILENLKKDYVIYAQARGLSAAQILWKHVLKNALPPMVTLFFQNIGMMIGGSAIVESVFSWPGLGNYFVSAIVNRDNKLLHNPQAVIGTLLIAIILLMGVLAPFLAPHDPMAVDITKKFLEPCNEYPFGTDQLGRCVLSRLLYGARYSLGLALPILAVLALIGTTLGMLCAWFGGIFDRLMTIVCDIFMAFPPLVIVLTLIGVIGQGAVNLILSIILSMWVWFVKVVRSYVLIEKDKDYITAAKISGCSGADILFSHILPNILPLLVVYFSTGIASIILMISGYSFLGLGLGNDIPEWGAMLNSAKQYLYSNPMLIVYPGICILLTAAGFNLFGEALRDILSPEEE